MALFLLLLLLRVSNLQPHTTVQCDNYLTKSLDARPEGPILTVYYTSSPFEELVLVLTGKTSQAAPYSPTSQCLFTTLLPVYRIFGV